MNEAKIREAPAILNKLIESLAQASGGCSQLIHARKDPRWLAMRNGIDLARDAAISHATYQASKVTMVKPR